MNENKVLSLETFNKFILDLFQVDSIKKLDGSVIRTGEIVKYNNCYYVCRDENNSVIPTTEYYKKITLKGGVPVEFEIPKENLRYNFYSYNKRVTIDGKDSTSNCLRKCLMIKLPSFVSKFISLEIRNIQLENFNLPMFVLNKSEMIVRDYSVTRYANSDDHHAVKVWRNNDNTSLIENFTMASLQGEVYCLDDPDYPRVYFMNLDDYKEIAIIGPDVNGKTQEMFSENTRIIAKCFIKDGEY